MSATHRSAARGAGRRRAEDRKRRWVATQGHLDAPNTATCRWRHDRAPSAAWRSTVRSPVCFCCRLLAGQLGLPLVRLPLSSTYRVGDADPPAAARVQGRARRPRPGSPAGRELARLTCRTGCASTGAGSWLGPRGRGRWSPRCLRPADPGPPRWMRWSRRCPTWPPGTCRCSVRGTGVLDHLVADRYGFDVASGVDRAWLAGLRVLVVDDSVDDRGAGPVGSRRPAPGRRPGWRGCWPWAGRCPP